MNRPPSIRASEQSRVSLSRFLFGKFTLQKRLTFLFIVLAVLTAALATFITFWVARDQMRQEVRTRLQDVLTVSALQIDTDTLADFKQPEQMETSTYQRMKADLTAILASSPDIGNIYVMRRNENGEIYFVINGGTDEETTADLGEVYLEPSRNLENNFDGLDSVYVENDPYTDAYGTWFSGYLPLYTSEGRRDAVLGLDLTAESVSNFERQYILYSLASFLIVAVGAGLAGSYLGRSLPRPFLELTEAARKVAEGDLIFRASISTGDERQDLAEAMTAMTDRMREMVTKLEARVQERTAEVEQRSRFIEAAAEVGRAAASILDADQLIATVVEKIRESFDLYYVGLFLLDETHTWVVLRAGTGEAGQKMLARGHRRKVGEGMVGWSVANNQARVASEVGEDLQRVSASELPETRSEAALPLRSRGQVIGVLTVQSSQLNAFDAQTVAVLQTMADQVATALDNARLFAEGRTTLEAFERANLRLSQSAWSELLQKRGQIAYRADETGVTSTTPIVEQEPSSATELAIPIQVRGVLLGHILAQKLAGSPPWNAEEKSLMLSLVEQLSVALDNARLYSSTQQSAARERVVSEITARVRASTNVSMIMQTAVQELAQALRIPVTSIQLRPSQDYATVPEESNEQASTARDEL